MVRRIAVLMTVLTLASATSAFAAAADGDGDGDCVLVGVGAEARDHRADPGAVSDPTGLCEMLSS